MSVLFCKAEVDDVQHVILPAHDEIFWLYVPMEDVFRVHVLHAIQHLKSQHEHGLQAERPVAEIEKVLQRLAQKIHDYNPVIALDAMPMHSWNADATSETIVNLGLVQERSLTGPDGLQLHGDV